MTTRVRVQLAGQFTMTVDGCFVDLSRLARRDALVLAYLVLERARRVTQSELADVVWEERVPPTWRTGLRGSVSRVRSALAEAGLPAQTLVTGPGWYELRLPPQTTVDVESAAAQASGLLPRVPGLLPPTGDLSRARELATAALGVARLPFLVGIHAAWVDQRQQQLDDLRLRCLEALATVAIHTGDWIAAREHAAAALRLAPLRESAHRLLALAHAGAGDRGEALRSLAACRRALAEDLAVPLSPETEALSTGLLRGAPLAELLGKTATPVRDARPAGHGGVVEFADTSPALVGRAMETGRLFEAWKRAAAGAPELAILAGEAGVGKSRLVAHLARAVAGLGATVLYGRCEHGSGGDALLDALRGHAEVASKAPGPRGLAEAVRSVLTRLGALTPVLLVLDDLQLLDRAGLALLRHLLRCPDPLPLLVVGMFRTGEPESDRWLDAVTAAGRDIRPATCIDLTGLPEAEVAELVGHLAGDRPGEPLSASIMDATGGNPLFVRELVELWVSQGRVVANAGVLALAGAGTEAVPDGVRETILARCRRLSTPARAVLSVAAVAGRECDLAQLEMVPELSTVDVLAALEEAVGARLMVERRPRRFAFVHGLVPQALRQAMSAARRQRLHADVATALHARPGIASPDPERIAYHLLRAGPEAAGRAVVAASRAAAQAQHQHAYARAAEHLAAALRVAGADPVVACRLRLEQAGALWRAGETARAQEAFRAAAIAASAAGRPDLAGHAVFGAAGQGPSLGFCDHGVAGELAGALRDLAPDDPFRPRLLARLAAELAGAPGPAAGDRAREALALAEAQDDPCTVAYARHCLNWVSLADPDDRDGLTRAELIIETGERLSDRHMEMEGRLWRCTFLLRAGRIDEVPAQVATLAQVADAERQPFFLRLAPRLRTTLALLEGRADEAEALATELYPVERRAHPRDAETHALLREVALAHTRGRWPDLGRRLSDLDGPHWTVVRGVWLAAGDRLDEATTALRPVLAEDAVALRGNALAPFVGALLARACAADHRLAERVDVQTVRSVLRPWAGTHAVAGCAVASLGPVDAQLAALDGLPG